jgi:hypothetical protein
VVNFFHEWLGTRGLNTLGLVKDMKVFPSAKSTLGRSVYEEADRLFTAVAFERKVPLLSLLDTRDTFVNAELGKLYGLPDSATMGSLKAVAVTMPDGPRMGFLGTSGFLAVQARATMTSPTLRGKFIRERLLCQDVPPPPPDVMGNLPRPAAKPETNRQRFERHVTDATCRGCHRLMDPIGFPFEAFDGLGTFRTMDNNLPVVLGGDLDGVAFDGPAALAVQLRNDARVAACFVQQQLRHLTGADGAETVADHAEILALAWKKNGGQLDALWPLLFGSEAFASVEVSQ